jgi:hypothetical protein
MNKLSLTVSLLPVICLVLTSYADTPVELIGQCDGYSTAVTVRDNYVYADLGPELVVLDISEPASPVQAGQGPEQVDVHGLLIDEKYMYIAGDAGLQVFDISNTSSPELLGSYRTDGPYASGVAISGSYAYVAAGFWGGLTIVDISNPSEPAFVSSYKTSDTVEDVTVSGSYAYVAAGHAGFQIIDISNPSTPLHVGGYDTNGFASDIALTGNYTCIAAGNAGLKIIDISNPLAPGLVGSHYALGYAHGVFVSGNWAYVSDGLAGLSIFDISNPSTPTWLGGYDTEGYAHSVFVCGSYAYVADGEGGLAILRVGRHGDLAPPNGYVNLSDLAQLAAHWSEAGCARPEGCDGADLDNDTDVDFADLSIMAANWLQSPGSPQPPPPPPKGRSCFPGDSPVWVNGKLMKISNVLSGQNVVQPHSSDLSDTSSWSIEKVEEHKGTFECRDILLESGYHVSVVDAHCFMLDSGQWIAAHDLKSGLKLKTLNSTVGIKSVEIRGKPFVGKVYNLKIKGTDRYFVGKDRIIVRDY